MPCFVRIFANDVQELEWCCKALPTMHRPCSPSCPWILKRARCSRSYSDLRLPRRKTWGWDSTKTLFVTNVFISPNYFLEFGNKTNKSCWSNLPNFKRRITSYLYMFLSKFLSLCCLFRSLVFVNRDASKRKRSL